MSYFSTDFTLGILGGGQLGKMLLTETLKYDIRTIVLDPSAEAPARFGCHAFFQGDLMDYDTVYQFGKQADLITFEIENVNVDALERLESEGIKVYPTPKSLRIIQDKGAQKAFYKAHGIPTAPFEPFPSPALLATAVAEGRWTYPFVWKSTRFGYDGNGVKIVRNPQDLHALPEGPCIAELCADIDKELAVIVARSPKGEVATYPIVEMEFHPEANQVEYVLCPARIAESISDQARKIALQVAEAFGSIGLLAVELFLTKEGEIWVNEVAPRPHNSGHYSIEASYTSQFEQHLRAILNLPLGSTESKVAGVMVNLVGAEGYAGDVIYEHIEDVLSLQGVTPHIYGKRQTRPFRKMGHITITHPNIEQARSLAQKVKETIKVISKQ
ncbi:5-(carboxyamino)imidazole ribonucleotide synthase [Capnocytophaga gingivalis]|uniref:N5-carboxyaminoimidazole ribonucleotide synthase n=1 Tax=Capnocytophaga gingivalis TaxID=1017 RepID=A0ABU5Z7L3_9FLAO|nr:5-(carboxyamino)imidazole ribonucleotide synthase [Capnocytophaga gingivalis]MEB3074959.1 5-(carboxyamino)imidazole ribonucleotide synthase [Capnocytophaga gingivalis]